VNTASAQQRMSQASKLPRFPIRNSDALVEIVIPVTQTGPLAVARTFRVRCGSCEHRLFDIEADYSSVAGLGTVPDGSVCIVRKCPSCDLLNEGRVTSQDGRRWRGRAGLAGPWICECGKSLGHVNDIRGRIRVTCKCKHETRVIAAEAIAVASEETVLTTRTPPPRPRAQPVPESTTPCYKHCPGPEPIPSPSRQTPAES
jgi:hypothetical protein